MRRIPLIPSVRKSKFYRVSPDEFYHVAFDRHDRKYLEQLSRSGDFHDRLLCLDYVGCGQDVRCNRRFVLEILDRLAGDRLSKIRWPTLHLVGSFLPEHPKIVWPFVVKYGCHPNQDLRGAVACFLLEHLLENHFDKYFPEIEQLALHGDRKYLFTIGGCWPMGQSKKHWTKVVSLLERAKGNHRSRRTGSSS